MSLAHRLCREQRHEIERKRLVSGSEHELHATFGGALVVGVYHSPHPWDLTREIYVVRSVVDAGPNVEFAVSCVRSRKVDESAGSCDERIDGLRIGAVRDDDRDVLASRRDVTQ